jgi:hypothetical protein
MLRALGLAVVGPDGAEVSRPRSFYRATIAFGPILAGYPLTNGIPFGLSRADAVALVMLVLIFIAGAGFAFLHPRRGLQDRLARTYVVARWLTARALKRYPTISFRPWYETRAAPSEL